MLDERDNPITRYKKPEVYAMKPDTVRARSQYIVFIMFVSYYVDIGNPPHDKQDSTRCKLFKTGSDSICS